VIDNQHVLQNPYLYDLASGPLRLAKSWPIYFVNGYTFHTKQWGEGRTTYNSGVCVSGIGQDENSSDYYGVINEILELEWPRQPIKKLVLFNCEWFDTSKRGMRVHKQFGIVEVHKNRKYAKFDPFIFAETATQVYYAPYPGKQRDKIDWLVVMKTKPKGVIDNKYTLEVPYQEEQSHVTFVIEDDPVDDLQDVETRGEEVDVIIEEENDFIEIEDDFIQDNEDEEEATTNEEEVE